jgi:hypothetical protein
MFTVGMCRIRIMVSSKKVDIRQYPAKYGWIIYWNHETEKMFSLSFVLRNCETGTITAYITYRRRFRDVNCSLI